MPVLRLMSGRGRNGPPPRFLAGSQAMLELLSPHDAYALFCSGGAFLVDVRTEKEFLKKAIPGCPLLPLEVLPDTLGPLFAGRPVVFFCRSGRRTREKAEALEKSAPGCAFQMEGGILAWEKAGFPVWSIRELLPCYARPPRYVSGRLG